MRPDRADVNVVEHPTFDKRAYKQYRIARRYGEAISGVDDPTMVTVGEAVHMRGDDYVIGLVFRGSARAYPIWVIDNYHVVNERIDDVRFFVTSCERCQSGAAFVSSVEGSPDREPLFRSVGFLNATLVLKDLRSGSHWIHYEGVGLDRRATGVRLPWIPTYHVEWDAWVSLHPDTVVMAPPRDDPTHPDARHGHGREELFARPGMDPSFIPTIVGDLDESYDENALVLGLDAHGDDPVAYPLDEVRHEGGVVHDVVGGRRLVIVAGPDPDGFTMAAFVAQADGRDLTFARDAGAFRDLETGSRWTIEGAAVDGPLVGSVLEPEPWSYVRWHAWIYSHRGSRIFRSERGPDVFEPGTASVADPFDPILAALRDAGHDVRIGEPLVSQRRPREAVASLTVFVDGDPVNLHAMATATAASDLHAFGASWSIQPLRARLYTSRTRRIGQVVMESAPERRFVDPTNVVPVPDAAVAWAKVLDSPVLDELEARAGSSVPGAQEAGFQGLVRALRIAGYEVIDVGFLPPGQLRVGAVNGIAMSVDGERFLVYRFGTVEQAERYASDEPHARAFGRYVLRSTPETMYELQAVEVLYAGDAEVRWSSLLDDARVQATLGSTLASEGSAMAEP